MDIKDLAKGRYILWGANWSLYTAKARSYLIKKGIDYVEICPTHPHYKEHVQGQVGNFTVPVLEYPNGKINADSTYIIYDLEKEFPENPMNPENRTMAALAWFIHHFGSEGMPRPAMHYRWSLTTGQENVRDRAFIANEFARTSSWTVHNAIDYLPELGIVDGQKEIIERFTEELYDILHRHFLKYPYILGGRPSAADFGLITPFYPHLGRDISSSEQIKSKFPAIYRWIETMNRAQILDQEVWHVPPEYFEPDTLPDTIFELLKLITSIYGPELIATADAYHEWLNEVPDRPAGTLVSIMPEESIHQPLGMMEYEQYGKPFKRRVLLDPIIKHQELNEMIAALNGAELKAYEEIMQKVGGQEMLDLKLRRALVRENFCTKLA